MKKIMVLLLTVTLVLGCSSVAFAATSSFVYEGEAYYKAQSENPAADLQPGEQINIKLSDNADFVAGTYKLTVNSCGNRESLTIKVNDTEVGTIGRAGTGFGMDQMTNDVLETEIELTPEDTLSVLGQEGEFWGWVDFVQLDLVSAAATDETTTDADSDTTTTDSATEADVPKTGVEFPTYLIVLAAASAVGFVACTKVNKSKSFNQ